jgi:hypothetical protein
MGFCNAERVADKISEFKIKTDEVKILKTVTEAGIVTLFLFNERSGTVQKYLKTFVLSACTLSYWC